MILPSQLLNKEQANLDCLICNHRIDPNNESAFVTFSCNVRAFRNETFKVWRALIMTIHCLDVVDLAHYAKYPFAQAILTQPLRFCYRNIYRQLTRHGFSQTDSMLDYGCGNGLFLQSATARLQCVDMTLTRTGRLWQSDDPRAGPFDYIWSKTYWI